MGLRGCGSIGSRHKGPCPRHISATPGTLVSALSGAAPSGPIHLPTHQYILLSPPDTLQLRGHPNILRLHAAAFAGPKGAETDGFLLVDHCPDTLLGVMQRSAFALDERTAAQVFSCVASGIAYMHRLCPPLAHR